MGEYVNILYKEFLHIFIIHSTDNWLLSLKNILSLTKLYSDALELFFQLNLTFRLLCSSTTLSNLNKNPDKSVFFLARISHPAYLITLYILTASSTTRISLDDVLSP